MKPRKRDDRENRESFFHDWNVVNNHSCGQLDHLYDKSRVGIETQLVDDPTILTSAECSKRYLHDSAHSVDRMNVADRWAKPKYDRLGYESYLVIHCRDVAVNPNSPVAIRPLGLGHIKLYEWQITTAQKLHKWLQQKESLSYE